MTDLDILNQVTNTLDNIEIPAKYVEQIGIPVSNCSNLLKALAKAVRETVQRKQEEEAAKAAAEPIPEELPVEEALEDFTAEDIADAEPEEI